MGATTAMRGQIIHQWFVHIFGIVVHHRHEAIVETHRNDWNRFHSVLYALYERIGEIHHIL